MYKLIFLSGIIFTSTKADTQYPVYSQSYAEQVFNLAASAYPVYGSGNGSTVIDQCLSIFPAMTWDTKATVTSDCGLKDNDGNQCQMFFAASSSNKTLVFAFRGTVGLQQFWNELISGYEMDIEWFNLIRVNGYFYSSMKKLWDNSVHNSVTDPKYAGYTIIVTGHSLGGALATLTAFNMIREASIPQQQIQLITFGEPRVGNYEFANELRNNLTYIFRVVHGTDPIPHLPFCSSTSYGGCSNTSGTNTYYQHPQEIWYHGSDTSNYAMGNTYTNCSETNGEDINCSDQISDICFVFQNGGVWHTHYFGHDISTYGVMGCKDIKKDKSDEEFFFHYRSKRDILGNQCSSAVKTTLNFLAFVVTFYLSFRVTKL